MKNSRIEIRPHSSAIGAELSGVDLRQPLDEQSWTVIKNAFAEHLVLFFRDQPLTPAQQVAFSRRFGALEPYPYVNGMEGYPELIEIVKMPEESHNFGSGWHVDMSFTETPPLGAVVQAIEVPPVGGDTMFCNMYLAYETLSEGMRELVGRVRAVHDSGQPSAHSSGYRGMAMREKVGVGSQSALHSLVRQHPVTGRPSLFISPDYCHRLDEMTGEESAPILDMLEAHATQHAFTCRFRWEPNSIVVWDNRCIMHNALEDDLGARAHGRGFKRVIRRATLAA